MRLAFDWGEARIGVAACDREGLLAYPVETVAAGMHAVDRLVALVAEYEPAAVVIGLPTSLRGTEGPAAERIRGYAESFAARTPVPVLLSDERLTTVVAATQLRAAGRSAKRQRSVIDQQAAVAILEGVLEAERRRGEAHGTVVSSSRPSGTGDEERA